MQDFHSRRAVKFGKTLDFHLPTSGSYLHEGRVCSSRNGLGELLEKALDRAPIVYFCVFRSCPKAPMLAACQGQLCEESQLFWVCWFALHFPTIIIISKNAPEFSVPRNQWDGLSSRATQLADVCCSG